MALTRVNPHQTGTLMKEMVHRAIESIYRRRFTFEIEEKVAYSGQADLRTTADIEAQRLYLKYIQEYFPGYGVIAEEHELKIECIDPEADLHFTVDPLDGTKAFARLQSHGIGTMIALANNREVIAAYVGNVPTREIFGFRPDSSRVYRILDYLDPYLLELPEPYPLERGLLLLRDRPDNYSLMGQKLLAAPENGGLFRNIGISDGSIGITFSRLWKKEVAGVLLQAGHQTPWDSAPVLGISQRLGYKFLKISRDSGVVEEFEPHAPSTIEYWDTETLVVAPYHVEPILKQAEQFRLKQSNQGGVF